MKNLPQFIAAFREASKDAAPDVAAEMLHDERAAYVAPEFQLAMLRRAVGKARPAAKPKAEPKPRGRKKATA